MARVLIIGAGGVGSVVAHKCAQNPEVFTEIMLASRTVSKCDAIAASIKERTGRIIETARVNADDVPELVALIKRYKPVMVINVALPYQDLTIMDACLEAGVHYMDTANYEPLDVAKFEYKWQWAYQQKFKDAGLMALLGSGFDPGVTNVFAAYAQKHLFDEIHVLDIIDCNAGDHGQPFATNFNPEINIREVTAKGRYWERGEWVETDPLSWSMTYDFPDGIGPKKCFLMYHEELESLVQNLKGIRRVMGLGLLTAIFISMAFFGVAYCAPEWVLGLFNSDPAVVDAGCRYLRIVCFSYPAVALTYLLSNVLRGTERVKLPLYVSIVTTIANAFADYGLIFGAFGLPRLGVEGAALATCISSWLGPVLILIFSAFEKNLLMGPVRELFAFRLRDVGEFYARALPVTLNEGA